LVSLFKVSFSNFSHTQQLYTTADENEPDAPAIAPQQDAPVIEPQQADDTDDAEIVDGPTVLAYVALAKTPRK
jgi:hypothetical protein